MSPDRNSTHPKRDRRALSRGQIAIIFAGSILTFVALCAVVVDVSWYWANTLRVQRAADAAALAGAVYLPASANNSGTGQAFAAALASAKQNGYDDALTNVKVTPRVDTDDPRQLDVQIDNTVGSFFAHALGISSWGVTRIGEGVYIQPVPMGSPDAYYGVGDFSTYVTTSNTTNVNDQTDRMVADTPVIAGGQWTASSTSQGRNVVTSVADEDSFYAFSTANNQQQQWANFGLISNFNSEIPNPAANQTVAIRGIELRLLNTRLDNTCNNSQVRVDLSWNGGTNWSTAVATPNLGTSTNNGNGDYTLGSITTNAAWGNAHTWIRNDFTDANFRVRLTYVKGCGQTAQVRVDEMDVRVGYTTGTTTQVKTLTKSTISNPNGTVLPSRGAWGTMLTRGADHENGDAYGPANDGGSANDDYDPTGYDYIVDLPNGGTVAVFDPGFCAMGSNGNGGTAGTGDHWVGAGGAPVSTYYTLWNTKGAPGLRSTWSQVYTSGTQFENQKGYDPTQIPVGDDPPDNATSGCDATHDSWWTMPTGNLGPGKYAIQVQTTKNTDANINKNTNAENMWALDAMGSGAQIFGNGRMAVYNNLRPGLATQQFYLAQIDKQTGAGKTALLDIFDPGDVAGDGILKILSPNGGSQTVAAFTYTSDGNCINGRSDACSSPTGRTVTQIQTANDGSSSFNNTWIHIRVAIPTTYGNGGLWEGGWWQIQYQVPGGGNDTTTWQVSVQGNPVHLIVP